MTELLDGSRATGGPGIDPRWTRSAKEGIGTACSDASRLWYTTSAGIVNEVYFPTIDSPQIRDLQYLVADGAGLFHDERRHTDAVTGPLDGHSLGYRIVNREPGGRYRIEKELFADPDLPCLLLRTRFEPREDLRDDLRLYVLLAPHLEVGGRDNSGYAARVAGRTLLTAHRGGTWLALGATIPLLRVSCGYVGTTDGWTDLSEDGRMSLEFDRAEHGNIALTGELDPAGTRDFTLGLAFGTTLEAAVSTLLQSLARPADETRARFVAGWERACRHIEPLEDAAEDGGDLYRRSHSLLLAHQDKTYRGAGIASLSIPWGDHHGDDELGGYHLVWTRDLVNATTALLASGNAEIPLRALIYLSAVQRADGGFHQNFWLDGTPYWEAEQLDEAAFPILLAWRLREQDALGGFDPYPMVLAAAGFLVREGPSTPQERWEENSGYSPSTLASNIAALTCAADMARERGDGHTAEFLQAFADFLHCHVVPWT
ncbi:MAG TPA: glycoside hydrolase family 15 protein, partial [Gemmatimonadota bacterium]|nr:glycoside hydrolase family 15 protein [Gemmatimonadota bacterium]